MKKIKKGITGQTPNHWLNFVLWPLLKLFWEPFSRKNAHKWQWRNYIMTPVITTEVKGNIKAKPDISFWNNFIQKNFGWQEVVIFERKENKDELYRIGFTNKAHPTKKDQKLCSLVIRGPVALLVGPYDVDFFAEDFLSKKIVPLILVEYSTKKRLPKNIPLL